MRIKIDYGIDLGTTNSAIARMENGVPIIKKTDTLKDTLPSCVHFNKKEDVLVGDPAFNVMKNDNIRVLKTFETGKTNTYIEFKRTMGTTHEYESTNMSKSFTSQELSAEVLKKMKSFIQDENISSIVITVPAKFLNPQKEAAMQAAKLAGFKHVELLQEPVAAATAYGLTAKNKDSYWLVFDFGGGTFDAALIKSEEGILTVKDTEGDNWLGGKNLDEAIVDQIIIPYLQENYAIDYVINDTTKREILRNAVKPFAEDAKIQLSFKDSHNILSNLGDLPFEDENGDEPEIDITVTQQDMERVLSPIFQQAIDISKGLLKRNNLKGLDLGALILVGGPTYSPILRRMLKEQITDKVDTSVDPMTVVAKGAALFASTISVADEVKEASRDKTKLQLDIKYEATSVELEEMVNIKVLREISTGIFLEKVFADIVRADGAWSSGKQSISEKSTLIDVRLVEDCSNSFTINVYDEQGNKLECQPDQFSILQGIGGLEGMSVLPYNIGIGRWYEAEEKDLYYPVKGLEKNKKTPAIGVTNGLKTRSAIRPGIRTDIIRIPIYQGDYNSEGSNPVLNNWVTDVIISGESLPALLPEDSDVDITIKVDRSEQMLFSAYFPLIDHTEELQIQIKQTEALTEDKLYAEIAKAKRTARAVNAFEILNRLEEFEQQLNNEKGSADGKMRIWDGVRKELLKLDEAEKSASWPKLEQELKNVFYELEDLVAEIKDNSFGENLNREKIEAHIQEYKEKIGQIIKDKNQKEAKKLVSEIWRIDFELRNAITGNAMDVQYLQYFNSNFGTFHWKDASKARQLINQGLQLANAGKTSAVRPVLLEIAKLMSDEDKGKINTGTLR
ncbi:MAG: Hsp70 family protein [Prevotellaceae bacterium]|jgi:molecular chaperone DnaK|nr:Hsp70 family protein [Prevotellaceae bacterium]